MTNKTDNPLDFKSLYIRRNLLDNAMIYLLQARAQGIGIGRKELEVAHENIDNVIRQIGDRIQQLDDSTD